MEFKFKLDDVVFYIQNYAIRKHAISAISITKESTLYTCDGLITMQEKDLYSDYDECKKVLILELEKKLKELQE